MTKSFFKILLILIFILGILFLINTRDVVPYNIENYHNKDNNCPNILIKEGNSLILYNSSASDEEPIKFNNLDEYIKFLEVQRSKGIKCPVLFLQSEVNTQGEEVYRMRPGPFDMQGGLQQSNQIIKLERDSKGNIIPLDATRDNTRYNQNNYPSFDSHNLHMGQFTSIDNVHRSTINGKFSDNPMDSNWGGVEHTRDSVISGKYKGREVKKPRLYTPDGEYNSDVPTMFQPPQDIIN